MSFIRTQARTAAALAAAALLLTGCTLGVGTEVDPPSGPLSGSITVFAAASLTETFTALGAAFEAEHPGTDIAFNFAGSSTLVTQLEEGAPADVFASANLANMTKAVDAGLVDAEPAVFAVNRLQIAVPVGNPAGIGSFADLAAPGVVLVVCAEQVPCGAATAKIEQATGITLTPASEETQVTDVLGKVIAGEADAGLVYVTDVLGADGAVEGIDFAEAAGALNEYPIAVLAGSANPELALAFFDAVLGEEGRAALAAAGFAAP